jgi:hypothetical protein
MERKWFLYYSLELLLLYFVELLSLSLSLSLLILVVINFARERGVLEIINQVNDQLMLALDFPGRLSELIFHYRIHENMHVTN